MRIVITAEGQSLDAEMDPRFGRCQYFIIADPATLEYEAIENSSAMAAGGAGISAAQMIADKKVEAVLTGNCGPNAYQVLSAAGIQVITGVSGTVRDAIKQYNEGKFKTSSQPNVAAHYGTGMGGTGFGMGMGRGMGMKGGGGMGGGMGRGMGGGMGRGMGMRGGGMGAPFTPAPQASGPEQELDELKNQSEMLAQQLSAIQQRIEEMEKKKK